MSECPTASTSAPTAAVPFPPPPPVPLSSPTQLPDGVSLKKAQLWDFLLDLLLDRRYLSAIQWSSLVDYEFKFLQPERVARLWGERKRSRRMSYEKMSRALRYYYDKAIIQKSSRERYMYRYACGENRELKNYIDWRLQLVAAASVPSAASLDSMLRFASTTQQHALLQQQQAVAVVQQQEQLARQFWNTYYYAYAHASLLASAHQSGQESSSSLIDRPPIDLHYLVEQQQQRLLVMQLAAMASQGADTSGNITQ